MLMTGINFVGGNQEKQSADAEHIQVASLKCDLLLTCATQIISASFRSSSDTVNGLKGSSHFNEARPIFLAVYTAVGKLQAVPLARTFAF